MAKARLVIAKGHSKGKVFPLEDGSNLIGRWDPDAGAFPEIDLDEEDVEAKVSRKHAVITIKEGQALIEDIGSLNGTYVNRSERLPEGIQLEIKDGDEVIVGKVFCRFEFSPEG